MQQTVRIVPGLPGLAHTSIRHIEQTVSSVQLFQEVGGVAGRILFVLLMLRIAAQRTRLRTFLGSALVVYGWMYLFGVTRSLMQLQVGMFLAALLFNGLYSFWGNYLPRVFPTYLRGTGESFAFNIGGKTLGASAALLTTQLANVMPATDVGHRLAYSAGIVATVCLPDWLARKLPPPRAGRRSASGLTRVKEPAASICFPCHSPSPSATMAKSAFVQFSCKRVLPCYTTKAMNQKRRDLQMRACEIRRTFPFDTLRLERFRYGDIHNARSTGSESARER